MQLFFKLLGYGIFFLLTFISLIYFIVASQSSSFIVEKIDTPNKVYTALVLGAYVKNDGNPSLVFKDRIDKAIELYREGKVKTILVSGDDGQLGYNEVNPTREYLLAAGVPGDKIFLDHAGFDTYSSMYRAKEIFLVNSVIITTQSFHLPRSVFIARNLGIDAYGISADSGHYLFRNNIREVFADVKAFFNIIYKRKPKYLGEEIPITGDSSPSI